MDTYRPRSRDYDLQRSPRRDQLADGDDEGFRIRGRASRSRAPSLDYDATPPQERSPSRVRRAYRDVDSTYHRDRERRSDHYRSSSSHDRHRSHYRGNRNGHFANEYSEVDDYDEPPNPPDNNGDEDVSRDGSPFQFLLIRGLKPNVDETLLSKGLEKLYLDEDQQQPQPRTSNQNRTGPINSSGLPPGATSQNIQSNNTDGAPPKTLKRVFVIRDRVTNRSVGYGFAEYHSTSDAKAALAKAKALGEKCTISSKPIAVDFPHLGIFQPVVWGQSDDNTRFLFKMPKGDFRYHDTRYYASVEIVNEEPPARPKSPTPPRTSGVKTGKKRLQDSQNAPSLDGVASERAKKPKTSDSAFAMAQMWQKKQAELRGEEDEDGIASANSTSALNSAVDASGGAASNESSANHTYPQSFVYHGMRNGKMRKCCLLCSTELQAHVTPEAHVKGSAKHAANLKDEAAYEKGFANLKNWGVTEKATVQIKADQSPQPAQAEYKDRAKERREQEKRSGGTAVEKVKISLKSTGGSGGGAPRKDGATTSDLSDGTTTTASKPSYGKGMNMLQKAGWKEGQALGLGDGIAAPIEQNVYAAGVGLGHEGSKKGDAIVEANRMTRDDRGSFLQKTKEVARERFERMG